MLPTVCNPSERYQCPGILLLSAFVTLIHVTETIYSGPFVLGLLLLCCGIETFHIFFTFFFFTSLAGKANMEENDKRYLVLKQCVLKMHKRNTGGVAGSTRFSLPFPK